jgi:hypothetical protein
MKLKSLLFAALALAPSFASAHPGHGAFTLHLHSGTPSVLNAFDPMVVAATLLVVSLLLASRLRNQR